MGLNALMNGLGTVLFFSTVFLITRRYEAAERTFGFPSYGYIGAGILIGGQALAIAGVVPVATYFTAIAWTGYILWADAAVFAMNGRSLLRTYPQEFAWLAVFSIPLWLIFEAYNLSLENWIYIGLPSNVVARMIGYLWAFATIWPGIFETAALLGGIGIHQSRPAERDEGMTTKLQPAMSPQRPGRATRTIQLMSIIIGAVLLIAPVLMPAQIRPYLFGAVWLGFIFFLEPINYRIGAESLWRDLEQGRRSRLAALLMAGAVCGIFWEFWNYSALARWVYVFPMFQNYRIFAMPALGYLGFPPFALECFAMFAFVAHVANRILAKMGMAARFRPEALDL